VDAVAGEFARQYSQESFWAKLKKSSGFAGREAVKKLLVLYYAGTDAQTPRWAKGVVAAALGYFIVPLDAIPDIAPFAGYTDDWAAVAAALVTIACCISPSHVEMAKEKADAWFR
jgi:uncharacterized membrane protein YkvA (DUF1232 family)